MINRKMKDSYGIILKENAGIRVLLALSGAFFSTLLIPERYYVLHNILISYIGAFVGYYFILGIIGKDFFVEIRNFSIHKSWKVILCVFFSLSYLIQLWSRKNSGVLFPFNAVWYHVLAVPAACFWFLFAYNIIRKYVRWLYGKLNQTDKLVCTVMFSVMTIFIVYNYIKNLGWYSSAYDSIKGGEGIVVDVLGLDNGGVFYELFSNPKYYDIRHPLLTTIVFPVFSIVNTVSRLLVPMAFRDCFNAIILQEINMCFLVLTGIHIRIASERIETMMVYYVSFPFFLYGISFEKYQICVFCLTLYWVLSEYLNDESAFLYALACLLMPTSCVIGVKQLRTIKENGWGLFLLWVFKALLLCICYVFIGGKSHILYAGLGELLNTSEHFTTMVSLPTSYKIIATIKMIHNCLLPIPCTVIERLYTYDNLWSLNVFPGIIIICICLIGGIVSRLKEGTKSAAIWAGFAFLLFVALNWVPQEAPLFSIYFSWAVILLFVEGGSWICEKVGIDIKIATGILCFILCLCSLIEIGNISKFYSIMGY